ncbi:VanW family protein [Dermatobacter hominis]|uniref:VanW family protein n=1 Tax=Dermatobacter hominis TaxID=2884263 RepID=UPI001D12A991|nr:VanW family protein [Dermatobacter hominis]UDY36937.1 VanW family protein [Dermatobacter hominis]
MSRPRKVLVGVIAAPLIVIALVASAWAVDAAVLNRDAVVRNVELAGEPVGGMTKAQLTTAVEAMAEDFPSTEVTIDAGDVHLTSTAGELGMSIDVDRSVARAWDVGRDDPLPTRPVRWLGSVMSPRTVDAAVTLDGAALTQQLAALEGDKRSDPVEPSMTANEEGVALVPGKDGIELTTNSVAAALPSGVSDLGAPIAIDVQRAVTKPKMTDQSVQALVDKANQVTTGKVELSAAGKAFEIEGKDFRPAFAVVVGGTPEAPTPQLTMNADSVAKLLAANMPAGSGNPTGVRFAIQGGVPVPQPGQDAQVCCGPEAPQKIVDALLAGTTKIDLPTRTMTAAEGVEWAKGLGVKQVVGEFTTRHPAGQPRVKNIHTISDATRGVLIAPGDTFSVNQFIGKRTPEKGYVQAPVIENGEHTEDYGGGISQYATTLFNAAFFAGLDIPAYKAHSEYISRYPFGREATLAYPSVDLKIKNNTPYGVVIWPTYTDSSITVQLWSTQFARGEQTAQNPKSGCGKITTQRTRTFVDGHTDQQNFSASYRCI